MQIGSTEKMNTEYIEPEVKVRVYIRIIFWMGNFDLLGKVGHQ